MAGVFAQAKHLLREGVFDSPQLTHDYRRRSSSYCIQLCTIQAMWMVFLYCASMVSYIGASPLPASFWGFCLMVVTAVSVIVVCRYSAAVRRHIIPLFCCYCISITVFLSWMLEVQAQLWTDNEFGHVVRSLSGAPDTLTPEQLHAFLGGINLRFSASIHLLLHAVPMICLCVATNNWCTMLAMWALLPSFLLVIGLNRYSTSSFTISFGVRLGGILAVATVLKLYLGAVRLASFMTEVHLTQELQAARMSDTMLSHSLKNTMSDVASTIDLYLNGEVDRTVLRTCSSSLCREIRGCCDHAVFVKLVSGTYSPKLSAVNLRDFGGQLTAGREVLGEFLDLTVYLDDLLCHLILERILSSAFRNHNPDNAAIQFQITEADPKPSTSAKPGSVRVRFAISYWTNRLSQRFQDSLDNSSAGHGILPPIAQDDISLKHSLAVAQQYGVCVSEEEEEGLATFAMELDVLVAAHSPVNLSDPATQEMLRRFPTGLNFFAIDDSTAARQLLAFHIRRWMSPGQVHVVGAREAEVLDCVDAVLQQGDVVICDQHLDYSRPYLGTDIVRELRRRDFRGFICIRSANNNPRDVALYMESGADCIVGKDVLCSVMMDQIKAAYVRTHGSGRPPRPRPVSPTSDRYQPLVVDV
eukprot:EG_transcript_6261